METHRMSQAANEQQTQQPAAPNGQAAPPKPEAPKGGEKQPPWGKKPENFDADKAWEMIQNLRVEKSDPDFRAEFEQFRTAQQQQRDALASALGVKPEETTDSDKLAQQIDALRGQILSSEKRALAVEFHVPEAMLTATDTQGMREQAAQLVEFAQGAHYAALTSTTATQTPPPPFQQNPGQGQGNTPPSPEALAAAEYEKYYPGAK